MAKSLPFATQDNQYPFSYLRMGQSGYNSPGVVLAGDMQVSPGTGLQVQISAGEAYVQQTVARLGSFYAQRGVYQIFDDSADNPYNTITAPVTYPRVDQVIARVYDSYEQSLSGSSYWRYEWLPGTETSGAQINNPSGSGYLAGAAALPDNSLRLAYCLATVSMSSWSSGNINILNVAPFNSQWRSFTPVVTPNSGSLTSYTATGAYQKVNSQLSAFQFNVDLTNIGTASSDMYVALPSNFTASAFSDCIVRETAVTGAVAFCYIGGGHLLDVNPTYLTSSTSIWSNGYTWRGLIFIPGTWS